MRAKSESWVLALALLSFLAVFMPHQARADVTPITTMCNDGSRDANTANNRSAHSQAIFVLGHNINTMFPLIPAYNQCIQNLENILVKLPNLADPWNIAQAVIAPIVQGLIGNICSQIMSTITSAQNAITQLTKICLPMPKFDIKLDLPTFKAQACSGGIVISPITGFTSPARPFQGYSQYQSH